MRHSVLKPDGQIQALSLDSDGIVTCDTVQCSHCLAADSKIITQAGVKNIASVEFGDLVQDGAGHMVEVVRTHRRSVAGFHRISARGGGEPLLASAEHPLLTLLAGYSQTKDEFVPRSEPEFTPAGSVIPGMWLALQTVSGMREPEDFCGTTFDENMARFVGLYLAEGCIGRDRLEFGFHKKEVAYIDFVRSFAKERLGANSSSEDRRGSQTFKLAIHSSKLEQAFLGAFGRYAVNKKMPLAFLTYPERVQRALMGGLLDGDGHYDTKRPQRSLKTISPHLAYQGAAVLRRLGFHPSITSCAAYTSKEGVNHQKAYTVRFSVDAPTRKKVVRRHFTHAGHVWVKVMNNEWYDAEMEVFNLTTTSGTFVANGFVTHNCGRHWQFQPGSCRRRGWCMKCNRITCGSKECDPCRPVEQYLENVEQGKPLDHVPVIVVSGWEGEG